MLEIGTRDWYMPSTCLDTRVALPPGILIISEMGTLSVYVATRDRGEQRTFILLFWSQVSYNIIHIVRYNVALFSLPKKQRVDSQEKRMFKGELQYLILMFPWHKTHVIVEFWANRTYSLSEKKCKKKTLTKQIS